MRTITLFGRIYEVVIGTGRDDEINLLDELSKKYYDPDAISGETNYIIFGKDGDNHIVGGFGHNIILAGDGNNLIEANSVQFDKTAIVIVGNGSNQIYTALKEVHFDNVGALNDVVIPFVYGSATVIAGDGGNYITGNGLFSETQSGVSNFGFTVDVGTITYISGSGSDEMYGLVDQVIHHVFDVDGLPIDTHFGQINLYGGGGTDRLAGSFQDYLSDYHDSFVVCHDQGGDNVIYAGSGVGDLAVGDTINTEFVLDGMRTGDMDLSILYPDDTAGLQHLASTYTCTCGDNLVVGGDGAGDILVGDLQSYSMTTTNTAALTAADILAGIDYALEVRLTLGNSTIIAGKDGGLLIGDVQTLYLNIDDNARDTVILGDNILIGGEGNDTMVGAVQNLTIVDPDNVDMFWGQNTFVFDLSNPMGHDTIWDMNVGHNADAGNAFDILKFTGIIGPVDSHITSFSDDGAGHQKVTFDNGGSITFANIAYSVAIDSIDDITPHVVVA